MTRDFAIGFDYWSDSAGEGLCIAGDSGVSSCVMFWISRGEKPETAVIYVDLPIHLDSFVGRKVRSTFA